jgi:hypothetical protein
MATSIERLAKQAQEQLDIENASNPIIKQMMSVVKSFLKEKKVLCYGGTAINNLLPKEDQFYNPEKDIPDYDFFSETPQVHAMELADRLHSAGIGSVEAKPGMHLGTFKVFGDYIGVADITHLDSEIFEKIWKEKIEKDGINYAPPNFLRMSVYLELSRPRGDVSRWKKVYTRLSLLNKHYPMLCPADAEKITETHLESKLKTKIESYMKNESVVLLGMNAVDSQTHATSDWNLPLDLLATAEDCERVAHHLSKLFEGSKVRAYTAYAELLPPHYDIVKGKDVMVRLFETSACHSYHVTPDGLFVASIPTLLQFFLGMLYADKHFVETSTRQRILCTAQMLVEMAHGDIKRRYKLLTPITCLGKQSTLVDMREEKSELYTSLKKKRSAPEFLEYFFSYNPDAVTPLEKRQLKQKIQNLPA